MLRSIRKFAFSFASLTARAPSRTPDANALTAYLKSLKPVRVQAPPPTAPTDKAPGPYLAPVIPQ